MNINKVFVLGRLTADPVSRTTPSGQQVTTFSLATNRVWYDKTNGKKEDVEFHNIVVWGRQADVAARFLTKGGMAFIEGRLQTRSWDDKSGGKRRTTEIVAESLQLGPRAMGASNNPLGGAVPSDRQSGFAPAESASGREAAAADMPSVDLDAAVPMPEAPAGEGDIRPEDLNF